MDVNVFIEGVPYGQKKVRGDIEAPVRWTSTVVQKTKNLPKIKGPCVMSVFFALPEEKYPTDLPYGPDLDNHLKRLCDALNQTVFSDVQGHDSVIVNLIASKRKASQNEPTGAKVIIQEVDGNNAVPDRATSHLFTEIELPNMLTSLQADYETIERVHDSIHEFMYLIALCLPTNAGVSWHSKSAFLTCHWEAFHQIHRSFLEALSGYYNTAYVILRSTLELLLKGAFWECLAHKCLRERATLLDKGKGKRKSVKDWVDSLIELDPAVERDLEETSVAIFDKTAILFDDQRFQRQFVHLPSFSTIVKQVIEWQVVDISNPYARVYTELYGDLSRDVHVFPDAIDVGRRFLSERDFMEIEIIPNELTKYLKTLHKLTDIGIVIELNILKDWMESAVQAKLKKRVDVLRNLGLEYSVKKLRCLTT